MIKPIIVTIPATCMDESVAFFTGILQFSVTHKLDRPGGVVLTFLKHEGFTVKRVRGPHIPAGRGWSTTTSPGPAMP